MTPYFNLPLSLALFALQGGRSKQLRLLIEMKRLNHIITRVNLKQAATNAGIKDDRTTKKYIDYMYGAKWLSRDNAGLIYLRSFKRIALSIGGSYRSCVRLFHDQLKDIKGFLVSAVIGSLLRFNRHLRKKTRKEPVDKNAGVSITGLSTILKVSRGYACELRLMAVRVGAMLKRHVYLPSPLKPSEVAAYCSTMSVSPNRFSMRQGRVFEQVTDNVISLVEFKHLR